MKKTVQINKVSEINLYEIVKYLPTIFGLYLLMHVLIIQTMMYNRLLLRIFSGGKLVLLQTILKIS